MPRAVSESTSQADRAHRDRAEAVKARDHLESLYAEWLTSRAELITKGDERTLDEDVALGDREARLAREIATTPAVLPWMVWHKLEVLEHYLINNGAGTDWRDQREIVMLGGIKADLVRFRIDNLQVNA